MSIIISASQLCEPTEFYTSDALEQMLDGVYQRLKLPKGRLEEMTGIKKRGCYSVKLTPSEIAAMSAKSLLEENAIDKKNIDALIYTGVCRDSLEPSTSSQLHHLLGLSDQCLHFDLSNACLGMMNGIHMAVNLLKNSNMQNVLVVTGENSHPMLKQLIEKLNQDTTINRQNIKQHIASLTLGGASLSFLISKESEYQKGTKILGFHWKSDTSAYKLCQATGDYWSPKMHTDSEQLMHSGIKLGKKLWESWDEAHKLNLDYFVTHQVGSTHELFLKNELKLNHLKTWVSYPVYGNTGSAAVGLTWHLAKKNKNILPGMQGVWLGIGSGLNAMLMHIID